MNVLTVILALMLDVVPAGQAYLKQLQPRDSILIADQIEPLLGEEYKPFPSYEDLLFSVQ